MFIYVFLLFLVEFSLHAPTTIYTHLTSKIMLSIFDIKIWEQKHDSYTRVLMYHRHPSTINRSYFLTTQQIFISSDTQTNINTHVFTYFILASGAGEHTIHTYQDAAHTASEQLYTRAHGGSKILLL